MNTPRPFRIIPCAEWGARPAKNPVVLAPRPRRAIFHHTAGHAPHLDLDPSESYAEAVAYASAIQRHHMVNNGWNDSGHNFLVTRNGYIFEGRRGSLAAVMAGKMVVSAHCVGQNDQPGVELEHTGAEQMTEIQRQAAIWLFALLCRQGDFKGSEIYGHRQFNATACPGALYAGLPRFRADVIAELQKPKPSKRTVYDIRAFDDKGERIKRWPRESEPSNVLRKWNISEHKPRRVTIDRIDP